MKKVIKIKNAIKRKVNESRLRGKVSSILDDALPNILAEIDQLDQAFLDAKPVKEEEDLEELDVRKTHGDKRIENPATGNDIKLRTALKAKKGSAVYAKGKAMYNALKDKPTNERAYASTDGKPYFDYDPGEGKLTEAEDYKYKKYVKKSLDKIFDEMFKFRHAMGVKQSAQADPKIKKILDELHKKLIYLKETMKNKGLTEAKKIKPHGLGYRMNVRRAKADFKKGENIAAVSKQGLGSFKIEDQNDFNKYHPLQWDFAYIVKEGKLTEESAMKAIINAKKGAKASGGGYSSWTKISNNSWKNKKTGRLAHNAGLYDRIGQFSDFVIEGKLNEVRVKKGDAIKMQDGEIGIVNKVKGRVAYIKLDSMPGSFHPIEAARITYKGKHKGKDLYNEDYSQRARNFRVALRRRLDAMKKGKKIKYGKLTWTALGNGNFKDSKGRTVPHQEIVQDLKFAVKGDILQHRGAAGDDMVNAYLKFEGKLTEAHPLNKVIGGYPVRYEGDPRNYRAIVSGLTNDRAREDIIKRASKAGYIAKPNMGGGVTIFVKEGKLTEAKFYVTYNQGRGMGKKVVTSKESDFEDPRVFRNYNDAEKYVKMAKSGGGSPGRITAYWVSDANMNRIDKAGRRI